MIASDKLTVLELRRIAADMLVDAEEGAGIDSCCAALITLGVAASVTSLQRSAIDAAVNDAVAAGATVAQIHETISLVSGLGVHSLMASFVSVAGLARRLGCISEGPLDAAQQELWDRHVGGDQFWSSFEREVPGFLDAMLRLSPDQFTAFFAYCAVPWKGGKVRARCKELISLAVDATPAHRFLPGFRLHVMNALALGAGRRAVLDALDIAADAPEHVGTR